MYDLYSTFEKPELVADIYKLETFTLESIFQYVHLFF